MKTKKGRKNSRGYLVRTASERRRLIELFKSSDLSQTAFSQEHKIHLSTLSGWLSREKQHDRKKDKVQDKKFCFVSASVGELSSPLTQGGSGGSAIEIMLQTGVVIRFRDTVSLQAVSPWLKEVLSC